MGYLFIYCFGFFVGLIVFVIMMSFSYHFMIFLIFLLTIFFIVLVFVVVIEVEAEVVFYVGVEMMIKIYYENFIQQETKSM